MDDRLISPDLVQFVARHFGARGREWLSQLPERVERYRVEWRLEVESFLPGGLMSCCLAVRTTAGDAAVLKLAGPWTPAGPEAFALRAWNGGPAPLLLRADETGDALLLERISPADPLIGGTSPDQITRLAKLLRALHAVPVSAAAVQLLPALADVVEQGIVTAGNEAASRSRAEADNLRPRRERARNLGAELLSSWEGRATLLHGDLEKKNILRCASRGLVAIDPLPCIGDAAYDAGYWVATIDADKRDEAAVRLAEGVGLDHERIRGWAAVVTLAS